MCNTELYSGRWVYHKPNLIPDEKGNIIIISKVSFGPLEVYEWGIDSTGKPYESYRWCEDDFFEYQNYRKNITGKELNSKIQNMIKIAEQAGLSDWIMLYRKVNENFVNILKSS